MEFITLNAIPIAYQIIHPQARRTIFFIHGNSGASNAWQKQLDDPIFSNYRLIAFDLPAHGQSGFPHVEDCTLPRLAQIMSEAVTALAGDASYMLVGVSLATNIIAEMLYYHLTPAGIVLAGPCIIGDRITMEQIAKPHTHVGVVFTDEASPDEVLQYAGETSLSREASDATLFIKNYEAVQKPFRSLLAQSIAAQKVSNEIALLQQQAIPLLIIFGKDEKIVHPDYLDDVVLPVWNDTIYKLPGASHLVPIDQPQSFNRLLAAYAAERLI